jgi:hypothetical protein
MTRLRPLCLSVSVLSAAWGIAGLGGCASRTVYVIDDRPDRVAASPAAPPADDVGNIQDAGPAAAPSAPPRFEDDAGIGAASDFVEPLSPYGRWVNYPGQGLVFVPAVAVVGPRFRPYTHGHWEYTDWGWTWVDHHPFGWATGHYGRWFYDAGLGWVWVPGTTWAPAWVTWRTGGGYVGWAAMPPGSMWGGTYAVYDTSWVFVTTGNFGSPYVGGVLITGPAYRTCSGVTVVRHDTVVYYDRTSYRGPDYDDVRRSGTVIHRPIRETDRDHAVSRPPPSVKSRRRDRSTSPVSDPRGAGTRGDDDARGRPRTGDNARDGARTGDNARDGARTGDNARDGARTDDNARDGARTDDNARDGARTDDDARSRDGARTGDDARDGARSGESARDDSTTTGSEGDARDSTPRPPRGVTGRPSLPGVPTRDIAEDKDEESADETRPESERERLVPMPGRALPQKELLDDPARLRDVTRPSVPTPTRPSSAPKPGAPEPSRTPAVPTPAPTPTRPAAGPRSTVPAPARTPEASTPTTPVTRPTTTPAPSRSAPRAPPTPRPDDKKPEAQDEKKDTKKDPKKDAKKSSTAKKRSR